MIAEQCICIKCLQLRPQARQTLLYNSLLPLSRSSSQFAIVISLLLWLHLASVISKKPRSRLDYTTMDAPYEESTEHFVTEYVPGILFLGKVVI